MTYHASDIGTHGLPYPHSHLTGRERLALYRGILDASAAKQRPRPATLDGERISEREAAVHRSIAARHLGEGK